MSKLSWSAVAIVGLSLASPGKSQAAIYNLHVGGMCSTNFNDGKGGTGTGSWSGETSINVSVSQTGSLSTAASGLAAKFDQYCLNGNTCYVYNYSAGDLLTNYVLDHYSTAWNIGYVVSSAGAGGGSNMADDIASTLACAYANNVQESNARSSNNPNNGGEPVYRLGGYKTLFESSAACAAGSVLSVITLGWVNNHCLSGDHDGAVEYHSAGAFSSVGDYTDLWHTGYTHWTNHYSYWTPSSSYDEGDNLNHYEMKRFGVCMDGGIAGQTTSTCTSWADSQH